MCGIAGIIGVSEQPVEMLNTMLSTQKHRGPDATHIWQESGAYLGHNRLSIIDLSKEADQPMLSTDGRYVIVFNGEIYNYIELKKQCNEYSFQTHSDTEVILALFEKYGKNFLTYLNGMFALAIWDRKEQKLFAARDRFGVKPFYYTFKENTLYFSSEIKTLFLVGISKEKNTKVWANYYVYGSYGLPDETFYKEISQLSAGHYFEYTVNQNMVKPVKWYDFVANVYKSPKLDIKELKEVYFSLLKEAVSLRFRADVPVGFTISGGLDSSVLLALVNHLFPDTSKIEAFTFYSNHPDYDELPWVKAMIEKTANPLSTCLLDVNEVPELIEKIAYYEDEPFGGLPTLAYSNIFKTAQQKGIKVLLDGQGMDEAWAGYDYYLKNTRHLIQGVHSSPVRPEVLSDDFIKLAEKDLYPTPFDNDLQNLQYRDLFFTKIPRALRFNDRVSMMYSTELREPFLDYRLVELAFAQSKEVKIQNNQTKWLLRELVKDLLGEHIAFAPKRPLQTPQREWIKGKLFSYFDEKIRKFSEQDFVKKEVVLQLWKEYQKGSQDNSFYIWQWVSI